MGLSEEEAKEILTGRRFRQAVDEDWERARELGVTVIPTLFSGDRRLVGFQSDGSMRKLL